MAPLEQGDKLGEYIIERQIGKGKLGTVFLARASEDLGQEVAIKYPANSREIVTLKKLAGCLGVPRLYASGIREDVLWVAMERLGPPLTTVLHTLWGCANAEQRWQGACLLGRMLLRRLRCLHQRGLVHGDIKPENILIACKSGSVTEGTAMQQLFLVDFGLTRDQSDKPLDGHVGTIEYSSIHSMSGGQRVRLDDCEALGWMLLHIMAGDLPWFDWIQEVEWTDKPARSELLVRVQKAKIDLLGAEFEHRYAGLPLQLAEYLRLCYRSVGSDPASVTPDYHQLARLLGCWTINLEEDSAEDIRLFNQFYVAGNLALPKSAPRSTDRYYVTSNWNKWGFEEMKQHYVLPDVHSMEVLLPQDGGEFQIVCNKDRSQVYHPALKRASQNERVIGPVPGEAAKNFNWAVTSRAGAVVEIVFQRPPNEAMHLSAVSWKEVRRESVKVTSMARWLYTKYFLVGTWDKWVGKREMRWDGKCFSICVQMGHKLLESFQILEDGDWNRKVHPDVKKASPYVPHKLMGPEKEGHNRNWTIGAHPDDRPAFGAQYVIRLLVGEMGLKCVEWRRL